MLQVINKTAQGQAQSIDKLKSITGYLCGVRWTPAKGKPGSRGYRKPSSIFVIQDKKTGDRTEVWGCYQIDANLLVNDSVDPVLQAALVCLTFKGTQKIKGQQQPMKLVKVEADINDQLPTAKLDRGGKAKSYQLKK